ncbi:MAG TPA: DUF2723 domain-containing protein, partial [Candidatus Eisenbacteria bacterium]|nr:DUF2723 domain-containing protein [Candidatus Eisenbacteria bacterium]
MKRAPLLSGVVALLVYLALAPPVLGAGDSAELTLVLAFDGVAHPTGYPLWTLFGHLFVRMLHALGVAWPYAANAWSALGAAAAVALLHAAARRLLPPRPEGPAWAWETTALAPAALFLLLPTWTGVATVAEVYSWHQAWVHGAVVAFLAIAGIGAAPGAAALAGWGLLVGAGLAHHLTSLLVAAPLTLAIGATVVGDGARRGAPLAAARRAGAFVAGAIVPLLTYASIYLKSDRDGPGFWPALTPGWAGFRAHVTGAQYHGALRGFAWPDADRTLLAGSIAPILAVALFLLVAALLLARQARERMALGALLAAALFQIAFSLTYRVADPAQYFLPALGIALLSIPSFVGAVAVRAPRPGAVAVPAACLAALLAVSLGVPGFRAAAEERRTLVGFDGLLRRMWGVIPYREGIVLWRNDMAPRLVCYREFDGTGVGLEVWNPWQFTDASVRARFAARHGFDPVGDLTLAREDLLATGPDSPSTRAFFSDVAHRINERVAVPVVLFE